jgi:hypothetical protein
MTAFVYISSKLEQLVESFHPKFFLLTISKIFVQLCEELNHVIA